MTDTASRVRWHLPATGEPTMVPPADVLPRVLPTERLGPSGMAVRPLRDRLRRIADVRNVGSVLLTWGQAAVIVGLAVWSMNPFVIAAAVVLMGATHARFAILGHEAAHRLLFSNRRWNDLVGRWLLAYPAGVPFDLYRRSHFAHHRDEFGPDEPDVAFYGGYPGERRALRRRLVRDAVGISGWKILKRYRLGLRHAPSRPELLRIIGVNAVMAAGAAVSGYWWAYVVLWLLPWLTSWRVINRLRSIAEHGGMTRSDDRRQTTHHVARQSLLARFWLVPFNTGWHLAHHVDMGVPWRNLPAFHQELVAAGWVTDTISYPSYLALWRALASGPPAG